MGHAEDFVHTWCDGINRGGAADFVIKLGGEFFATSDDSFTFFVVRVPGVFGFGAGFLAEGRESDLREAIFDDFVAFGKFVFFPEAEFFSGSFDGFGDFLNLLVS